MTYRCVRFNAIDIDPDTKESVKAELWCRVPPRAKVVDGMLTWCGVGVALPLEMRRRTPTCPFCRAGTPRTT